MDGALLMMQICKIGKRSRVVLPAASSLLGGADSDVPRVAVAAAPSSFCLRLVVGTNAADVSHLFSPVPVRSSINGGKPAADVGLVKGQMSVNVAHKTPVSAPPQTCQKRTDEYSDSPLIRAPSSLRILTSS
jgi:hypothetical protein